MEVGEMDSPVWVPDSSATKCMHCHRSEFSMLNRRVSVWLFSLFLYIMGRPSDLWWARVIVPLFQNMAHHFQRQWAQWSHPF